MKPCGPGTCFTCRLAGLKDCAARGAPLPLMERERAKVVYHPDLTERELNKIIRWLNSRI